MLKLGLTGGIASGKSAVAAMLREMGFSVLDADSVAHRLMEPGQAAHDEILQEFGAAVVDTNGRIDRAKLSSLVFADATKLAKLNAILHPRVEQFILRQFADWERGGGRDAVFVEAALVIEAGFTRHLDGLVVAWCEPQQQIERLRSRGMTEADARLRMAAQMPGEEKLRHATETIDCTGSMAETRAQVQALAARIRKRTSA